MRLPPLQAQHAAALRAKSGELEDLATQHASELEGKAAELAAIAAAKVGGPAAGTGW